MRNNYKKTSLAKLIANISILFITLLCLIHNSFATETHSEWLIKKFKEIDNLNIKDPALALELAQKTLNKHNKNLSDFEKIGLLSKMAQHNYFLGHIKQSKKIIEKANALGPDHKSEAGIFLLMMHGAVIDEMGSSDKAMVLYLEAVKNAKETENFALQAESYSYIANSYAMRQNHIKSLEYFHKAYILFDQLGKELDLSYLKIQMSKEYSYLGDDDKAISFALEAVSYFNKHSLFFDELFAQNALARNYLRLKEYKKAETAFNQIIKLSAKLKKENFAFIAYIGLAKVYNYTRNNKESRFFLNKYREKNTKFLTPFEKMDNYLLETKLEIAENNIEKAEQAAKKFESILIHLEENKTLLWRIALLDLKAEIGVLKGDYKLAYDALYKTRDLQRFYSNSEREKVRSRYKVIFDTEQAILKNQLLSRNNQLDKVALESAQQKQWIQTLIIILISLILLMLVFFLIRQNITSKALHKLANTDSLTELANRRYTFSYGESKLVLAKKENAAFTVIIFDIDHFKKVNDTYGHAGGDIALKALSASASTYVRENDILGRIGGEEFLLVLPNTPIGKATAIAERIREAIEQKIIQINEHNLNITASFGVATLTDKQQTFNDIFQDADLALYQAKEQGRNRVIKA
ncbi:GGDEF domain-containing protein [Pseudoalteromonas sp. C2R02]|uniref:tetratricopeptide repeat-containing diguanylate cyclase n=1 Tax=Pseudoalteromonas sp. C2R02 TaxID=2841565 RepID=UPI001C0A0886|nr:GGDEF domain-containing protein [Pseudoalteromonas sp. C2R02]MBU2972279.1 GGDEF domain-containing protein [Pseudoalteromonas sp. C2R02]